MNRMTKKQYKNNFYIRMLILTAKIGSQLNIAEIQVLQLIFTWLVFVADITYALIGYF